VDNDITDLSPIENLTSLNRLFLRDNDIANIEPLVSGSALSSGDRVELQGNPLSLAAYITHIPALQARGVSVAFDPAGPTAQILPFPGVGAVVNATFSIAVRFGERVTGFDPRSTTDLVVTNGTVSSFEHRPNVPAGQGQWNIMIGLVNDGALTVTVPAGAVRDSDGNPSTEAEFTVTVNRSGRPIVSLVGGGDDGRDVVGGLPMEVRFSEPISGLTLDDFEVTNATVGNLRAVEGSTAIFSLDIFPLADGEFTFQVKENAVQDAEGNGNFPSVVRSWQGVLNKPTITGPAGPVTGPFQITIEFEELVSQFDPSEIEVGNGTASGTFSSTDVLRTFNATVTPAADGTVTVDIPRNVVTTRSVLHNLSADQYSVEADLTPPVAVPTRRATRRRSRSTSRKSWRRTRRRRR